MPYMGNTTRKASDIRRFDVTSSTSATHTLTWIAPNEQSLIVTINGIKQHEDSYSVSGVTLTLTSALVATDKLEVIGINDIGTTITPAQNSVDTDKILDDAVTAAKLANSINTEITANTAKVTNATHTGDVTGATALTIATDAVDIAMLSATGTADGTTFLRGDNAWASAGGDNTPAFAAYLGTTITGTTTSAWTKLAFNTEDFDTDSAYDNSTNYRFTVPSGEGGKYHAQTTIMFQNGNADGETASVGIYVNGSQYALSEDTGTGSYGWENTATTCVATLTLSAADYVEVFYYTKSQNGGGTPHLGGGSARPTRFSMHKLIGV
jgi:hypothetical protein